MANLELKKRKIIGKTDPDLAIRESSWYCCEPVLETLASLLLTYCGMLYCRRRAECGHARQVSKIYVTTTTGFFMPEMPGKVVHFETPAGAR
jgi:hypothetical protein